MADVQTYDQLTPAEVVRWRFDEETDQTKSKFSFPQGPYADVWLAWEIIDPNGIINSTIGGISYNLGGWYRLAALDHYT